MMAGGSCSVSKLLLVPGASARDGFRSVERRDATFQRFHVLPNPLMASALLLGRWVRRHARQVILQVTQRRRVVVEVIGEQPAIPQLVCRRRIDGKQQLGDVVGLRE